MKICLRLLHLTMGIWKRTCGMNGLFGSDKSNDASYVKSLDFAIG